MKIIQIIYLILMILSIPLVIVGEILSIFSKTNPQIALASTIIAYVCFALGILVFVLFFIIKINSKKEEKS